MMQSAVMLGRTNYNNVLTIGADNTGLFMVPLILFRAGHPALFVPWSEITILGESRWFFFKFFDLRLGRVKKIPFRIKASLAAKIQAAAGQSWPAGDLPAAVSPPPIE